MLEALQLTIDGQIWKGWKSARIERSLDAFAGTFELELTDTFPGHPQRLNIRPGAACVVGVEGAVTVTGYLDEAAPSYGGSTRALTVRGRDKTCDLVDCIPNTGPGEWRDLTPAGIAKDICAPFGIQVVDEAAGARPIALFKRQEGETARETIERAVRIRALIATTDGAGHLVLKSPGALGSYGGALVFGENILIASGSYSTRERFSDYTVKGQDALNDTLSVDAAVTEIGKATDGDITRYRPFSLIAEDLADGLTLKDRAGFEAMVRAARSRKVTYTVAGWRDGGGGIWTPGQTVDVDDPWMGVKGRMRIERVVLSQSEQGTIAELDITGLHAYDLQALADPKADGGMGW